MVTVLFRCFYDGDVCRNDDSVAKYGLGDRDRLGDFTRSR